MDLITLGLICGMVFGLFSSLIMVPMKFDSKHEKYETICSSFIDRFIGLIILNATFGLDPLINVG